MLVSSFDHVITLFDYEDTFSKGISTKVRRNLGKVFCSYRQTSKEVIGSDGDITNVISDFTMWFRDDLNSDCFIEFNGEKYEIVKIKLHGHRHGLTATAKLVK
jgi:hypothetical protein